MQINQNYMNLDESYLFSLIARKVNAYGAENPQKDILRLGIGDVTLPLVPCVIEAMLRAISEMGNVASFRGYGEEQGYDFLRAAICRYYQTKGVSLDKTEVFVSDGAKSDLGNILDIFDVDNTVLIPNPVYPVYVDTNIMAGRKIDYANGDIENRFLPMPPENKHVDIIYLCSPNNPTGAVYTKKQLEKWVNYALERKAVILFDSAYEAFVQDKDLPTSIYQVQGAEQCAIEFCSLSKTAGFTGLRCGYMVVPHKLCAGDVPLNMLWLRRQTTKFNGVSYVVQRGAEAVFSEEGMAETHTGIRYYMENAQIIAKKLDGLGVWYTGGSNSPYIWMQCPNGMSSWDYFDHLLSTANIVGTPGSGFGEKGEGFFRLTAFGQRDNVIRAVQRL